MSLFCPVWWKCTCSVQVQKIWQKCKIWDEYMACTTYPVTLTSVLLDLNKKCANLNLNAMRASRQRPTLLTQSLDNCYFVSGNENMLWGVKSVFFLSSSHFFSHPMRLWGWKNRGLNALLKQRFVQEGWPCNGLLILDAKFLSEWEEGFLQTLTLVFTWSCFFLFVCLFFAEETEIRAKVRNVEVTRSSSNSCRLMPLYMLHAHADLSFYKNYLWDRLWIPFAW